MTSTFYSSGTSRPGFKGFRRPEAISEEALSGVVENLDPNLFVYYTGGKYARRRGSLRSAALATIFEVKTPVPLGEFVRRAARAAETLGEGFGYDPRTALGGLALHAGARPAVYLLVERRPDGGFYAVKESPTPDPAAFGGRSILPGDVIVAPVSEPVAEAAPEAAAPRKKARR